MLNYAFKLIVLNAVALLHHNLENGLKKLFVNLKSNLALKSNKGHNLLQSVFAQMMSNNSCFPTKR